jgi:hypothetical protein
MSVVNWAGKKWNDKDLKKAVSKLSKQKREEIRT